MCETMSSYEEEREKMASIAMQIVIHAGDARNLIMEALDHAAEGLYDQAEDKLKEAREELRQAHIFQTEVVQSEAGGKKYEYSLLFTHAQDTVMTICTEMNLAKKIISVYRKLDDRISKLEEKAEV
jgi:cellobiose PTS system EIIA component